MLSLSTRPTRRSVVPRLATVLVALSLAAACTEHDASVVTAPEKSPGPPSYALSIPSATGLHVYARYGGTCILDTGVATCWGWNRDGRNGDGTLANQLLPTPVKGGLTFSSLAAADLTTCGLTPAGAVYCWGADSERWPWQTDYRLEPKLVTGGDVFAFLGSSDFNACGITTAGQTSCWPLTLVDVMTPAPLAGDPAFATLTGGDMHQCGLTATGLAYCWGYNYFGQVGDGTSQNTVPSPTAIGNGRRFIAITGGFFHTCGLDLGGTAYCWGYNFFGGLGDGTLTERHVPTRVATTLRFAQISAGNSHTCALTKEGVAYCWGSGFSGQLGNGFGTQSTTPVPVQGGLRFREISSGGAHTCAITRDELVYCWGDNSYGEIGDGTTTSASAPTLVKR